MISVCLACYNGEKYIKQQIDSILVQLSAEDELLISDDGSTDGTIEILKSYKNTQIKLFFNQFKSHIKNFEFVLSQAKGDYIFLSDQDDIWVDNKVAITLPYLQKYDLVLSDCILIDGNANVINDSLFNNVVPQTGFARTFYKNIYTGCCMSFNKKIAKLSLPFPQQINSHDMWIGMVAEVKGNVKVIDNKLIHFRRHGKNFSASKKEDTFLSKQSPYSVADIIRSRTYMLIQIIKLLFKNAEIDKKN